MSSLAYVQLGQVAKLNPALNAASTLGDELVDFLPMSAVDAEHSIATSNEVRQFRDVQKGYTNFSDGDVLVAKITPCFENGKIAQVRLKNRYGFGSTEFHVLRAASDRLDSRYLVHFLRRDQILLDGKLKMTGSAGQRRVPKHFLESLPIPLPALLEQRRIAAILDQADALRAKRREALAQLDSLIQSIFIDMFGDPVTNPKGWKRSIVGDVTDCIVPGRDKPKSFTGEIPWVTTEDLVHLDFTHHSSKGLGLSAAEIKEVKARVIPAGSVMISCVGNLGRPTIAANDMVINQQLHSFQCREQINNVFLMHCLAAQTAFMYAKASSTTLPYMNKSVCNSIPVQIPPVDRQCSFADRVFTINGIKNQQRAFLAELDALFASLQHRAFRGEL